MNLRNEHASDISQALQRSNVSMPNTGRILRIIRALIASGGNLDALLALIEELLQPPAAKTAAKKVDKAPKTGTPAVGDVPG